MRLNLFIKKRYLLYQLSIGFLSIFLQITAATGEYTPPPQPSTPKPTTTTTTTGTRGGCQEKSTTTLTAFAPQTHQGQTVSQFPTFSWFVPDSQPLPLEFRLYQEDSQQRSQLIEKVKMVSKPGIMQYSLPQNHPGLAINQTYRWQVVIFCNPNRPSTALVTEAIVKVVEMSPNLKQRLATTNNTLTKAELFAKSNFWYDALAEGFKDSDRQLNKNQQLKLLEILASSETSPQTEQIQNIIDNQRKITWKR